MGARIAPSAEPDIIASDARCILKQVKGMSRRAFLDGAQRFAVGGASAAALFEALKPNYAWAIQVPPDDSRIAAKVATVPSPQGNGSIKGYLVRPANAD